MQHMGEEGFEAGIWLRSRGCLHLIAANHTVLPGRKGGQAIERGIVVPFYGNQPAPTKVQMEDTEALGVTQREPHRCGSDACRRDERRQTRERISMLHERTPQPTRFIGGTLHACSRHSCGARVIPPTILPNVTRSSKKTRPIGRPPSGMRMGASDSAEQCDR